MSSHYPVLPSCTEFYLVLPSHSVLDVPPWRRYHHTKPNWTEFRWPYWLRFYRVLPSFRKLGPVLFAFSFLMPRARRLDGSRGDPWNSMAFYLVLPSFLGKPVFSVTHTHAHTTSNQTKRNKHPAGGCLVTNSSAVLMNNRRRTFFSRTLRHWHLFFRSFDGPPFLFWLFFVSIFPSLPDLFFFQRRRISLDFFGFRFLFLFFCCARVMAVPNGLPRCRRRRRRRRLSSYLFDPLSFSLFSLFKSKETRELERIGFIFLFFSFFFFTEFL